jgi:hypothetical protein
VNIQTPLTQDELDEGILNDSKWHVALLFMAGGIGLSIFLIVAVYLIILLTELLIDHYVITLSVGGVLVVGLVIYICLKYRLKREGYNEI